MSTLLLFKKVHCIHINYGTNYLPPRLSAKHKENTHKSLALSDFDPQDTSLHFQRTRGVLKPNILENDMDQRTISPKMYTYLYWLSLYATGIQQ